MSDVDPVTPDDEDEIFGSSWDCAECGAVVDFNLDQCQPCGGSEGKWDTANPVDPITPGDDAILCHVAYLMWCISEGYLNESDRAIGRNWFLDDIDLLHVDDRKARPHWLVLAKEVVAAAGPSLVAEAVAAERAKTASALAAMKRERAALEPYWNGGGPIFGYDMCIELLESALAAGSETTKEGDK